MRPMDLARRATLIILNEEMNDIMKIVKSGLCIIWFMSKAVTETIKNEAKEQKKRIYGNVIRYIRCYFIRKSISR